MQYSECKNILLKVGSSILAPNGSGVSAEYVLPIARFIQQCFKDGKQLVLVSSGSVAAGRSAIKRNTNHSTLAQKQAMAAVGQTLMMANWSRFFDRPCAQILMTHADLQNREAYLNIRNTIHELLANGILPIVNENDSVATEELKVGDNDRLAAMVAIAVGSDILMIASDVDGLFEQDPRQNKNAKLISKVEVIDQNIINLASGTNNPIATGGMKTKVEAAIKATSHGIDTQLFNGFDSSQLENFAMDNPIGTCFKAQSDQLSARKHWVKHTLVAKGTIYIDVGAVKAIQKTGASLLSVGIVKIDGRFEKGDAVNIFCDTTNQAIAKGISQYNHTATDLIKGKPSQDFKQILGYFDSDVVIERDDLVLI